MPNHEYFEELCAAASIGHASPEELAELEAHASACAACQQTYFDYLRIAAERFAAAEHNPSLSPADAQECLDSGLLTRRFLDRAQREGITFSSAVNEGEPGGTYKPRPEPLQARSRFRLTPAWATAAAATVVVLGLPGAYYYGRVSVAQPLPPLPLPHLTVPASQVTSAPAAVVAIQQADSRLTELIAANHALQARIDELGTDLRKVNAQLAGRDAALEAATQDREALTSRRDTLETQLSALQQDLAKSQARAEGAQKEMATAQQEAAKLREQYGQLQVAWVGDQKRIQDLTAELRDKSDSLDRERQLLSAGHDVTDLMAARNLHIVDVVDTDPRGKTRPSFGRIFFTEGKSLIFYAYDLNEARVEKASFQYRVWAKKEGGDKQVRNLGIFYSDDKTQKRWVFKCSDPKILSEIDSVFVTLEPADSDPARPKGQNLMYAYLRGHPNHL